MMLLTRPLTDWAAIADAGTVAPVQCLYLDEAAVRAVRASVYFSARAHGASHAAALRAQNSAATKVRRALGYTYPKADIRF